jgi:arylsulfatase A-like enzyme
VAYYAAVSYFDEHVGQVLEALRASGQENRTAVMLMGDHVRKRRASCSGSGTRASD